MKRDGVTVSISRLINLFGFRSEQTTNLGQATDASFLYLIILTHLVQNFCTEPSVNVQSGLNSELCHFDFHWK